MIPSETINEIKEQTSTMSPLLQVKNLSVSLLQQPDKKILKDVTIELYAGSIYALVGESGSGKSMTSLSIMRLLPDALKITSGAIFLKQQNLFNLTEQEMGTIRGGKVAMIFQDAQTSLNPVKKIGMQIHEALRLHTSLHGHDLQERTIDLMKKVGIPDPDQRVDWYPHQMSGGQQQRIMIAIALACNPSVLLADEPTTALDVTIQQNILELLKTLAQSHKLAVLLITHDMGVVRQTADRVGVMHKGKIIEEATCRDFFRNPQASYSKHLINSLPDINTYNKSHTNSVILKVEKLNVHFPIRKGIFQRVHDYTRAVNGISFSIKKGETLALVGESGCGKSTVGRAILNIGHISSGDIWLNHHKTSNLSHRQMLPFRKKMQVIFQNPFSSMNPRMTVGHIIEEGMISLRLSLTSKERKAKVIALLNKVRLEPEHRHRYPHEFSGGQRQRIAIARALAIEPELIICDEPTSSLDVSIRAEILDLLLNLQKELNVSYLFITHDLSIIPHMAHQIAVMKNGIIIEQGDTETIMTNPQQAYTQQLLSSIPAFI
ncbi:MAG: dipeptide ABC transporter ATP-binding protein [Candidatus Endonucleobacter bathymodioli]|uniref:Dipeptide ABC transporter ATP-binding protein n=1 Tax=Candidatus Endonucleibacter bathymodioli TaxID=539814 RepID=A0AA90SNG1_9GAMM|nr:dipeptide ABC transporter ATP-binding protein [Candidatus Endonucleobacter bathymodioli]